MQRLALFDLDNTLVDLDQAFAIWAIEFSDRYQLGCEAVERIIALGQGRPHREMFFAEVRERFALAESVDELWRNYRQRMPHLVYCSPEVKDGLSRLRVSGWKVAIVTNGMADNQMGKIQQTGLSEIVDALALSGIEGTRKPGRMLFEIAAKRCGMSLTAEGGGGWMIGDSPIADVAGGRAAGLRTIWIDRGVWPDHDQEADHVVIDVLQAIEILAGS
ncbi:HAD family hydrolase [Spongiactinospora rosea]|uniref:HAD family hydrolase n=1 Tax=Spongiactinospora rosea TaxID=2248750 RepID=A0A366LVM0_9ACTN|nr:HAD hydrolase-like protein [Spongiactinospora rosea]RBQ17807.1 HAD family hydrolase [Spongiactinospora rosea]